MFSYINRVSLSGDYSVKLRIAVNSAEAKYASNYCISIVGKS